MLRTGKGLLAFITFALFSILFCNPQAEGQGFLHRSGRHIANDAGTIQLRGVNIGAYLVPEGYIMGIKASNVSSPHQIHAAIKSLVGTDAAADSITDAWRDNLIQKQDIAFIKQLGFNMIRVPFHYNQFWDTTRNVLKDDGFRRLDSILAWSASAGIYVIPDLHCAPGSQNPGWHSDNGGPVNFWINTAQNWPIAFKVWKHIANRYKNNSTIGGYDLLNEPALYSGNANATVLSYYKTVRDSIRAVDGNHMLIAEANNYGYDPLAVNDKFGSPQGRWDNNMCLEIHSYYTGIPPTNINLVDSLSAAMDIPVWLGEFGENSNTWFGKEVYEMERRGYSWSIWSYKKVQSINPIVNIAIPASYNLLLNYWLNPGTVTKPTAAQCRKGFADLCANARYSGPANYQKDVVDALLRPDFLTRAVPYRSINVPDTIRAVDYDMGVNGTGCYGTPFWTVSDNPFTIWNNGWNLRNDAIGIEPNGGGYNVGWTGTGEWLRYTFNAPLPGVYTFTGRFAGYGGGMGRIEIDSTVYVSSNIPMPNTNDWHIWANQNLGTVYLPAGPHTLKFHIVNNGFNIKDFVVTGTHLGLPEGAAANKPVLSVYPNPAGKTLYIQGTRSEAELTDLNGRSFGKTTGGTGTKELNIQNLAPGLYLIRSENQCVKFVKE